MSRQTLSDILERMRRYCASQERCHSEIRTKLLSLKVYGDDLEEIMSDLISDDFLNEERYARSYARGKFRMNKWGRFKIRLHLQQKKISDYCIRKGLEEIGQEEYVQMLDDLIARKMTDVNDFAARQKVKAAMMRKGFEPELVSERIARYR